MTQEREMTARQERLLDAKLSEINTKLSDLERQHAAMERLRGEIQALERRGNKEQSFFAGRRSMAYELRESGGLAASRLGMEILYLLPDDFVEFYAGLFHRALTVGDSAASGNGRGGIDKAKGTTGTVLGSDTRLQSAGTGKRYRNTPLPIGSEAMLQIKETLDRELLGLVTSGKAAIEAERQRTLGLEHSSNGPVSATRTTRQCPGRGCRGFVKPSWKYCPMCGGSLIGMEE